MKKIKKITAIAVLGTMLLTNFSLVNAEWIHDTRTISELHNGFPLLPNSLNKDKQLCKIATSFDILNEDGTVKYTYYPQGCQVEYSYDEDYYEDNSENNSNESNGVDNFIDDIFDNKSKDSVDNNMKNNGEIDDSSLDFLDNIFGDNSYQSEEENYNYSSASENLSDSSSGSTNNDEDSEIEDADDILKEIFGKTKTNNSEISLKGSKIVSAIRNFNSSKIRIRVGKVEANVFANNMSYNSKVATLLKQIDTEFKIDSIKNDFSKNISKVSYSLSTYKNTKDPEIKKVFRTKLVNDLRKLRKKYKILKKKDRIISKILSSRI